MRACPKSSSPFSSCTGSTRTTNSSPPRRATTSTPRTRWRSRCATVCRTASPATCPRESLTVLNWSRSRNSSPTRSPVRWVRRSARSIWASASARLGSVVSASWVAWWAISSCSCSRSRMTPRICWTEACTTPPRGPPTGRCRISSSNAPSATAWACACTERRLATAAPRPCATTRVSGGPSTTTSTSSPRLMDRAAPARRASGAAIDRLVHSTPPTDSSSSRPVAPAYLTSSVWASTRYCSAARTACRQRCRARSGGRRRGRRRPS